MFINYHLIIQIKLAILTTILSMYLRIRDSVSYCPNLHVMSGFILGHGV